MAYQFKNKRPLAGIEQDRQKMQKAAKSSKMIEANAVYGSTEIGTPEMMRNLLEKVIEVHDIEKIDLNLIREREVNNYEMTSLVSLKRSIKSLGLFTPIIVRKSDSGKYVIISGHRRFRAFKEIVADYKVIRTELENRGEDTGEVEKEIEKYSSIPAIVFTVVDDNSELLGTDPKYITRAMEEEIYVASNAEVRQSREDTTGAFENIQYFYKAIRDDNDFRQELLARRNVNAKRKATKLNKPQAIADIVSKEIGLAVSPSYVYQAVKILDSEETYPSYAKKAIGRIREGEKVKQVYKDLMMQIEILEQKDIEPDIKKEYVTRMTKGKESIEDIYNEAFNIRNSGIKKRKKDTVSADYVEKLLNDIAMNRISASDALLEFRKYISG